jgi:hypothetical protein
MSVLHGRSQTSMPSLLRQNINTDVGTSSHWTLVTLHAYDLPHAAQRLAVSKLL